MASERWQYQVVDIKPTMFGKQPPVDEVQLQLNKLGQVGWELVAIQAIMSAQRFIFKRQM